MREYWESRCLSAFVWEEVCACVCMRVCQKCACGSERGSLHKWMCLRKKVRVCVRASVYMNMGESLWKKRNTRERGGCKNVSMWVRERLLAQVDVSKEKGAWVRASAYVIMWKSLWKKRTTREREGGGREREIRTVWERKCICQKKRACSWERNRLRTRVHVGTKVARKVLSLTTTFNKTLKVWNCLLPFFFFFSSFIRSGSVLPQEQCSAFALLAWWGLELFERSSYIYIRMYVFTQPLCDWQDVSLGQFLKEVQLVWIQSFPNLRLVVLLRIKKIVCPTIYR